MRVLTFLFLIIIVFLAGIIFAQRESTLSSPERTNLFWTESYSFESEKKDDQEVYKARPIEQKSLLERIAIMLEAVTINIFNGLLHILYEISRLFYTAL